MASMADHSTIPSHCVSNSSALDFTGDVSHAAIASQSKVDMFRMEWIVEDSSGSWLRIVKGQGFRIYLNFKASAE